MHHIDLLDLLLARFTSAYAIAISANGLPLGAEVDEKFFKVIMLDCGLCSAALGLSLYQLKEVSEIS